MQHPTPLNDPALAGYQPFLRFRSENFALEYARIRRGHRTLAKYAGLHTWLGLHLVDGRDGRFWCLTEYMPAARRVWLATSRTGFQLRDDYELVPLEGGFRRIFLPENALAHGDWYELRVQGWDDPAIVKRVPAFARHVEQNPDNPDEWCARVWMPESPYCFKNPPPDKTTFPRIYEAHVGMAIDARVHTKGTVGSYRDFASGILPRIKQCGYTAVQLMAVPEHPLYDSFGYQVSSYFAPSSRFGTPDEFKMLVDEAHGLGLPVLLDVVHGHACSNTEQGLSRYDTSDYMFAKGGNQWGTPSFDFSNEMTRRFLLSNCRFWMEEYRIDGFRFDAVGNILYSDHGIGDDFSHVSRCFLGPDGNPRANAAGELHLGLANALIHEINPSAISIAEEFSGMPGLTCPPSEGGLGFDYRFAMGLPDFWSKFIQKDGTMEVMWYEMTNHRPYDKTISYTECHDQCINGKDALIWRLIGDAMYTRMSPFNATWNENRGTAFYRMMRGITLTSADAGYLNFMGAEFGHPEWLDGREHAHRQWQLPENELSLYAALARWDSALMHDIVAGHEAAFALQPVFRFVHQDNRLLAFTRGPLLFAFNFHETRAEENFTCWVEPGKYVELLSSDEPVFGGHGNLDPGKKATEHFTDAATGIDFQAVRLYLPPMTMLVLERN